MHHLTVEPSVEGFLKLFSVIQSLMLSSSLFFCQLVHQLLVSYVEKWINLSLLFGILKLPNRLSLHLLSLFET